MPSHSEPQLAGPGPDRADLRTYLECAAASNERLLGFGEAAFCSTIFMRIKLSLLPDMTLDKFQGLTPLEKSTVDRLSYRLYLDWKQRNATVVDALMAEIRASEEGS